MPAAQVSFMPMQGSDSGERITRFLRETKAAEPDWRLGGCVRLPRASASYQQQAANDRASYADFVLADPETRLMHMPYANRGRRRRDYAYLQESDPYANRQRFVDRVIEAQVLNGRDLLISPWLVVQGVGGTERELPATLEFARRTHLHPEAADRTVLTGFEATERVIADTGTRNHLLNELVELPEAPLYLRMHVRTTSGPRQYAQPGALQGLREVVERMAESDRPVLLPQAGLMGWVMLGFGAVSFGSGVQFSMQSSPELVDGGGGGGGHAPLHWYFLPEFLGFVLDTELAGISNVPGFQACDCPYCQGQGPGVGDNYDRITAANHYLWWCAKLAAEVNGAAAANRATVIRDRLAAAKAFWEACQQNGVQVDS